MHYRIEEIEDALSTEAVTARVATDSEVLHSNMPDQWVLIHESHDPRRRTELALDLWGPAIRQAIPQYFDNLETRLDDVRLFTLTLDNENISALIYICGRTSSNFPIVWIGRIPTTGEQDLPEALEPLRAFFESTHSEFTAEDWMSNGILPPEQYDELRFESRIPDDDDVVLDDGRTMNTGDLLVTAKYSGALFLCLAPATGEGILESEGNFDTAAPYLPHLDRLMIQAWEA